MEYLLILKLIMFPIGIYFLYHGIDAIIKKETYAAPYAPYFMTRVEARGIKAVIWGMLFIMAGLALILPFVGYLYSLFN